MTALIIPFCVLGLLGLFMGAGLGLASKKLAVKVDPRVELIGEMLPGANCGACGFAGCLNYARSVVEGAAKTNACPVGGEEGARKIAGIMGVEALPMVRAVAVIFCGGDTSEKRQKGVYEGVGTCTSASLVGGGTVQCSYGCLGLDDCVRACSFGAMKPRKNLPPEVDDEKCKACGLCLEACSKRLIKLVPKEKLYFIACSSLDRGKVVRKVCSVGCTACKLCVKKCPEKAIEIENNLARIDFEKCKMRGECFKACATKCIQWKRSQPS